MEFQKTLLTKAVELFDESNFPEHVTPEKYPLIFQILEIPLRL